MKHLLLIANISIDNKRLIEYAADFCKHYKCKLHVLHINEYDDPILVTSAHYYNQNSIDYNKHLEVTSAKNLATKVSNILDQDLVQVSIKKGNQEKILTAFINDNFIDMIIIGNSEINKDSDLLDHRNLLLNVIDVPLLVLPDLTIFKPLEEFNFLTNHSEKDIEDIIHLSQIFSDSTIKISHNPSNEIESKLREKKWQEYVSAKVPNRLKFHSFTENVEAYIRNENHALVKMFDAFVFTAKKRNFWSRLLDPSTTLGYLAGLEVPCIIYKK